MKTLKDGALYFAPTHEWVRVEGEECTVGVSKFAVDQLTDLVYVELPDVGKKLSAGEQFGVVESVKAVGELYAPVAGEVVEVNKAVADNPSILSRDPYHDGWLVKLRLSGPPDATRLKTEADYDAATAAEH
jgi:glycine cleavage system H protein